MRRTLNINLLRIQAGAQRHTPAAQLLRIAEGEGITEIDTESAGWARLLEKYPIPPRLPLMKRCRGVCGFKGEQVGQATCRSCCGNVQLKVFACSVHGRCVVGEADDETQNCQCCESFAPAGAGGGNAERKDQAESGPSKPVQSTVEG